MDNTELQISVTTLPPFTVDYETRRTGIAWATDRLKPLGTALGDLR
jgi:hypothetical protein